MKKRLLSIMLTLAMMLSVLPCVIANASANEIFDFSDAAWVTENVSNEQYDYTKTYPDAPPRVIKDNAATSIAQITENNETFVRVSATNYPWILLRFSNLAPGKFVKLVVRPAVGNDRVQVRWDWDNTKGKNYYLNKLKPDANGWYTIVHEVEQTGQSVDKANRAWGILAIKGYLDIKYAECGDEIEIEDIATCPISSATICGVNAFVDEDDLVVTADTQNGRTTDTIGMLSDSDIEITKLNGTETVTPIAGSSKIEQTIAGVRAIMQYDITDVNGETKRWTFRKVSRNGYVFDLTDTPWVKAHMSNQFYPIMNTTLLSSTDPLIMPTNDNALNTELVAIPDDNGLSYLRAKILNTSGYNWCILRLDNLLADKYIKYVYKVYDGTVNPRWAPGAGWGNTLTKYTNIHMGPSGWSVCTANVGSCNTYQHHDYDNKAFAVHAKGYTFDLRYFACFDTQEQMESYDPSIQSATLNGQFATIDPFEHKAIFAQDAGDLDDVVLSTYFNATYKKKGDVYTYPSGAVAQKYIVTDYEGGQKVWTVQLGEGSTNDVVSILTNGTVKFDRALGAQAKVAALYKDGELVDIETTDDREIMFDYPEETGVYSIKTFTWDSFTGVKPLAPSLTKRVSFGNFLILGDSYSTFAGYIPAENNIWYTGSNAETDVRTVDQTWWWLLEKSNPRNKLILNESSSGTTVCNTGYSGADCPTTSFIGRLDNLINNGFFNNNNIDTVFVFGGTNDTWAGSPLGSLKYSGWTTADKKQALPAMCYLLDRLSTAAPNTRVVCILNTALSKEIADGYIEACNHYGADIVSLNTIDKKGGHPSILGMVQIKEQILGFLN